MIVIMGVSGCGKTTVGKELAGQLDLPFYDADDFHPQENIDKMQGGTPLQDADRWPWLQILAREMKDWSAHGGAVLACSALKESYREVLTSEVQVEWVFLHAPFEIIFDRMQAREHFMDPGLLRSQFDTLEPPSYGIHVNAVATIDEIVSEITTQLE
ncbi:MAG: gluconokinase [Bacteroidota bacterium]